MQTLLLRNETWSLELLPQWGGRIARLKAGDLDIFTPIQTESFNPLDWPRGGAYPLLPYSNRLRGASLNYAGCVHELPEHPAARPHTLHGIGHTLAWEVTEHSDTHALLACTYEGEHWPWPVSFKQHYELRGRCLHLHLSVRNLGTSRMPAGLGLHPYFQRNEGMRARFFAGKDWEIDCDYMPTGIARELNIEVVIPACIAHPVALYASAWDGRLSLEYPVGQLQVTAEAPLTHFVAFAPVEAPYLCLEPVSHLADAFNAEPEHWPEQGTQELEPGQTLCSNLSFTWVPAWD
jgi:aldose 1-epimerase